jgi:hypothetical protein
MTNEIRTASRAAARGSRSFVFVIRVSSFIRHSDFGLRHFPLPSLAAARQMSAS